MTDHPDRPDYLPVEVLDWADEHHDLLELVVQRLLASGEWPLVGDLTRSLAREGRPSPLSMLLHGMPKPLGFVESQPRRIVLLLFGLRLTRSGQPLLDGFATVLRAAVERFQGDDEHPLITSSDLSGYGSPQEPYVRALSEILLREAPFLGSGSGDPGEDWSREVTEDVVRYWNVTSAEDYVRTRAHELFAATLPGWPRVDLSLGSANTETANSAADLETSPAEEIRDAFISHASEDKASVARPLVELLVKLGHSVWFDEQELVVGSAHRQHPLAIRRRSRLRRLRLPLLIDRTSRDVRLGELDDPAAKVRSAANDLLAAARDPESQPASVGEGMDALERPSPRGRELRDSPAKRRRAPSRLARYRRP